MRFQAADYNVVTKVWTDSSGNGRHVSSSSVRGTPAAVTFPGGIGASLETFQVVQGGSADGIKLGNPVMANNAYTWFSVARYSGATKGRIFDSYDPSFNNYSTGFWNGKSGVAHHQGFVTAQNDRHGENWFVWMDQGARIRDNGDDIQITTANTSPFPPMSINYGNWLSVDTGDWQVAEILLFNLTLSLAEIQSVEALLGSKYGIVKKVSTST